RLSYPLIPAQLTRCGRRFVPSATCSRWRYAHLPSDRFHIMGRARRPCVMSKETTATPRRVLVVDDDPALLIAIADGLHLVGGYDVIAAQDGAMGLERFFSATPECVVVDVRMPGLNGYQFVRALRGDPETAQTPIIVLSALAQDHEQFAGLLTGADAYLT